MKTKSTLQAIDEKISDLKKQLLSLGVFHPGSLSAQYQVCGKAGCQCHAPRHPKRHGPYAKLTYVYHGKYTCRFVRAQALQEVRTMLATFKTFRQLTDQWVALAIQRAQLGPLQKTSKPMDKPTSASPKPSGQSSA
jgi:hypothetical protein